jgi:hypothetical protein
MTKTDRYAELLRQARTEFEHGVSILRRAYEAKVGAIRLLRSQGAELERLFPAERDLDARPFTGRLQRTFKALFAALPTEFDKRDVWKAIQERSPDLAAQTDERAVSAFLARLASEPSSPIMVKRPRIGRTPALYEKAPEEGPEEESF